MAPIWINVTFTVKLDSEASYGERANLKCYKLVAGILSMYSKLAGRLNTSDLTYPEAMLILLSKLLSQDTKEEKESWESRFLLVLNNKNKIPITQICFR